MYLVLGVYLVLGGVLSPRGCLVQGCLVWGVSGLAGLVPGDVWSGGCLLLDVSAPGGCLLGGMSAPRGCLLWGEGVSAPGGSAPRGRVSAPGGVVSQHALRQTPPLWTESQTPVKTLPWLNFVAAGKNYLPITTCAR